MTDAAFVLTTPEGQREALDTVVELLNVIPWQPGGEDLRSTIERRVCEIATAALEALGHAYAGIPWRPVIVAFHALGEEQADGTYCFCRGEEAEGTHTHIPRCEYAQEILEWLERQPESASPERCDPQGGLSEDDEKLVAMAESYWNSDQHADKRRERTRFIPELVALVRRLSAPASSAVLTEEDQKFLGYARRARERQAIQQQATYVPGLLDIIDRVLSPSRREPPSEGGISEHEREIARLKAELSAVREFYAPPQMSLLSTPTRWWLALSNYQLVNLREALRAIVRHLSPLSALNSGDWTGEILNVLETATTVTDPPNRNAESYCDEAVQRLAVPSSARSKE